MSYMRMDHAGWVQSNIDAYRNAEAKRIAAGRKPKSTDRGWLAAPERLTRFQSRVIDILGIVFGGIYNAPLSWDTVQWRYGGRGMSFSILSSRGLATFDNMQLTLLVFLCHEGRIRTEVDPAGRGLRLSFWPRTATGDLSRRHPSLDEAVAWFRSAMPDDHSIFYSEELDGPQPAQVAS